MEQNYFDVMQRARKAYARLLEPLCRRWGLTRSEMDILLYLANNPGFDRAADIVTKRGIAKSHVSMSVADLEERKLLVCRADPRDRRSVRLTLTDGAWEIAREGQAAQRAFFDRIFAGLSPEELALWQAIVGRVCENIEKLEEI